MKHEFFHIEYFSSGVSKGDLRLESGYNTNINGKTFYHFEDWKIFNRIMSLQIDIFNHKNNSLSYYTRNVGEEFDTEKTEKELKELKDKIKNCKVVATVERTYNFKIYDKKNTEELKKLCIQKPIKVATIYKLLTN